MNIFKAIRLLLIAFAVSYLFSLIINNVARVLRYEIGVSITSMENKDFNLHPLYTFCPQWSSIELEEVRSAQDFILSQNLDNKEGGDGFWSKKVKLIRAGRFVPCYTYERPNPVQLGTYLAVAEFIITMDDIDDLTLAIHDNHGYINTHYSDRGNNRLTFPTQTLGGKVERESRYEIATVLVDRLSSDECLTNPELKDNYCLEKNVAETLNCSIPGIDFEGKNDELEECAGDSSGLQSLMPDPKATSTAQIDNHLTNLFCKQTCALQEYHPELTYDKIKTNSENQEKSTLVLYLELKNQNEEKHEDYYVYDWIAFLSDFGGVVGLLLGYSLLTFYDQVKVVAINMIRRTRLVE